jgi:hypothetical protein
MAITIKKRPCPPPPFRATLMKTGQTTSYRTGDDGDIEAGRATDFFTLASNNPFGNTNRFTDELGGSTYANNWVVDWSTFNGSTVLGYYRVLTPFDTWNNGIDYCLATTLGTFTGCRMINIVEALNIILWDGGGQVTYNYAPFNIVAISSNSIYTSTAGENSAIIKATISIHTNQNSKIGRSNITTTSLQSIAVRTFTVTGTTLT